MEQSDGHDNRPGTRVLRQRQDLVLSNEAFDRFIAELDRPAEAVAELTALFRSNPKIPGD